MQTRVRLDDEELSEWFWVTQGLWQGIMPSPLPVNILLAAVLEIVLVRLSEVDIIVKNTV